jgi:aminoglycoside phosphotransferase (APT) family kinase protein
VSSDDHVTVDAELVDPVRLARWMDAEGLPGQGERPQVHRLSGGSQNELFAVARGGEEMVLRRPPKVAAPNRLATLAREHRLLRALHDADADVPHARYKGGTDDPDVLGAPFYLMEKVDGWSVVQTEGWPAPFDTDLEARAGLAVELVDGIARLARVDWRAAGLEGFGRPDGFHDRQVDRWLDFLARYRFRDLPGLDAAADWLRRHRPRVYEPGIMHGDYQFANVMYRHGSPARLAAIIDWEMATVGDPLLDLGWALIGWPPEGDDLVASDYVDYAGLPPREPLLAHYEAVSGRATDDIDYYVILARFKLAIVLEQSVARWRTEDPGNERLAAFDRIVLDLARKAAELAQNTV